MTWTQIYDPFHHWWLSTAVAAVPIVVLLGLLAGLRVKPHWSALTGALAAVTVAVVAFTFVASVLLGVFDLLWSRITSLVY